MSLIRIPPSNDQLTLASSFRDVDRELRRLDAQGIGQQSIQDLQNQIELLKKTVARLGKKPTYQSFEEVFGVPTGDPGQILEATNTPLGLDWGTPPSAVVRNNTDQTIPSGTLTELDFQVVIADNSDLWVAASPNRFVLNRSGFWLFTLRFRFSNGADGVRTAVIRMDGATTVASFLIEIAAKSEDTDMAVTLVGHFNTGHYFEALALQDTGGNLGLVSSGLETAIFTCTFLAL